MALMTRISVSLLLLFLAIGFLSAFHSIPRTPRLARCNADVGQRIAADAFPATFDIALGAFPTKNGDIVRFVNDSICLSRAAARAQRPLPAEASPVPGPFRRLRLLSFFSHSASAEPYSDGYGEAMREISKEHDVVEYNWASLGEPSASALASFANFDFILVKSDWNWYLDAFARAQLRECKAKLVLLISGSSSPPPIDEMRKYTALFYETEWYWEAHHEALRMHGRAYRAFGINTRVMNKGAAETQATFFQPKLFDYVFVGHVSFTLKRADVLLNIPGSRIALGHVDAVDLPDVAALRADGVMVTDSMGSYADLAAMLRLAKNVIVPTPIWGGGERAALEGKACGARVWVAADNDKVIGLLCSPLRTHEDYRRALIDGLLSN